MDNTTYATIERGSTQFLARILEPGKQPYYFVPDEQNYRPLTLRGVLCKAVNDKYGAGVVYVSATLFNQLVKQVEGRVLTLPDDYPPLQFQFGQSVYLIGNRADLYDETVYDEITGIRREKRYEDGLPDVYVLEYRVWGKWYAANELSLEPPAEQVAPVVVSVGEALQEDGLFLPEDVDLP